MAFGANISFASPTALPNKVSGDGAQQKGMQHVCHSTPDLGEGHTFSRRLLPLHGQARTFCSASHEDSFKTTVNGSTTLLNAVAPARTMQNILRGTILEGRALCRLFSARRDGFDNEIFFQKTNLDLGGVPCLVIGQTIGGRVFGGFNPVGFEARDDYRDTPNARLFVIKADASILLSTPLAGGKSAIFDFQQEAIKFGASALVIPMNIRNSLVKPNGAISYLGSHYATLETGETSLFGNTTNAELSDLEVWTDEMFVEEASRRDSAKQNRKGWSLLRRMFG
jgi:hypothetical protein